MKRTVWHELASTLPIAIVLLGITACLPTIIWGIATAYSLTAVGYWTYRATFGPIKLYSEP